MNKVLSVILSTSVFANALFANCDKPVTPLQKGEASPCSGYLFTPEKELEVRRNNEEYKLLMEQAKIYIQQKELYRLELEQTEAIIKKEQEKSEKWRKAAEDSTEKYMESEQNRGTRDWLFLIGGVILTVGAGYAVGQAAGGK